MSFPNLTHREKVVVRKSLDEVARLERDAEAVHEDPMAEDYGAAGIAACAFHAGRRRLLRKLARLAPAVARCLRSDDDGDALDELRSLAIRCRVVSAPLPARSSYRRRP